MADISVKDFWSSIIDDGSFQNQLSFLMSVEDKEERSLMLLSRCLFLLVMEIKCERDAAIKNMTQLKKNINMCTSCGKDFDDVAVEETMNVAVDSGKLQIHSDKEELEEINVAGIISKDELDRTIGCNSVSVESLDESGAKSKTVNAHKMSADNNCSLSRSPKEDRPKTHNEDEGKSKVITSMIADDPTVVPKVLAPETVSMDENELYINLPLRSALASQTTFVPETLAMENTAVHYRDTYENTDFFGRNTDDKMEVADEESVFSLDSSVEVTQVTKTPSKKQLENLESEGAQSPVLGQQNWVRTPEPIKQNVKLGSPKVLDFKETDNKPLQSLDINTPDLKERKDIVHVVSTSMYSPLVFKHDVSLDDSDTTSPSLLASCKNRKSSYTNENVTSESLPAPLHCKKKQEQVSLKTKNFYQKSKSSLSTSPSTKNTRSLRRHQTTDTQSKATLFTMTVEPSDGRKKKYQQTKLSASIFQQKTNVAKITGGIPSKSVIFQDDAATIDAVLKESLKTKAMDDLRRKEREAESSTKTEEEDTVSDKERKVTVLQSTPPSGDGALTTSKKGTSNISESATQRVSPIKIPKLSPGKTRTSPRKRCQQNMLPQRLSPAKKKKTEQPRKVQQEDKEFLELDQLIDKINNSPSQSRKVESVSEKGISPQRKLSKKANRKNLNDSFDAIPVQNEEPGYAHHGEVVRKKGARKQLEGWGCRECEQWYGADDLSSSMKKMLMNKCSRHRSKHNPVTNTPEGFWNPDWIDDDE